MSNFFSSIADFLTPDATLAAHAKLLQDRASLAGDQNTWAAKAKMLGIKDPYTGIDYSQPQGAPNAPLMGPQSLPQLSSTPQHTPLMGTPGQQPGGLMGPPPQQQASLYNQAFPDQAANMARIAPMMDRLPANEQSLALLAPEKWAEAKAKNLIEPDDIKLVEGLQSQIAKMGGAQSPGAAPYVAILQNKMTDPAIMNAVESVRHNKASEATTAAQTAASAVDVQPDPNNPGRFILVNKLKGTANPVGAGPIQLPPIGQVSMPTTGLPASGSAPQTGAPDAVPTQPGAPDISPANDFTPQLPKETEARITMLPPNNQAMVRAILTGRMAPPTGRILSDPIMGPLMRQAMQVDPKFDETTWSSRNKMVNGMADTSNKAIGYKIDTAKKLIDHLTSLVDAAADRDQSNSVAANYIPNIGTDKLGTGVEKAALNRFNQAKVGVSGEYGNLMTAGGGSVGEREDQAKNLGEDEPLTGTIGTAGEIVHQLGGQIGPLVDQYNGTMKTNVGTDQVLGQKTAQRLSALRALAETAKTRPITKEDVRETLAGRGLLTPKAAKTATTQPGQLPKAQAIVDELRKRGAVK